MMDNNSNSHTHGSHAGYSQGQFANTSSMHSADPFKEYGVGEKKHRAGAKEGGGFLTSFLFHAQVQGYEEELQYLNSNKADLAGTSVGLSDTFLRFLTIRAGTISVTSYISLLIASIAFVSIFILANNIVAYLITTFILLHTFFPGYIIYGMKKYVMGEKFTKKFYRKILSAWHGFEFLYVFNIVIVFFLRKWDWEIVSNKYHSWVESKTILSKIFQKYVPSIHLDNIPNALDHLLIILLSGFILYSISMFFIDKNSVKEQRDNLFEHDKERLRPAEMAKKDAGRYKG